MGPGSHGNSEHHKHSDFSVVLELLSWMGGIANGINDHFSGPKTQDVRKIVLLLGVPASAHLGVPASAHLELICWDTLESL